MGLIGGATQPVTTDGPNDFVERRQDPLVSEACEQGLVLEHCQPLGEMADVLLGEVSGKDISGSTVLGDRQPLWSWLIFLLHALMRSFFMLGLIGGETP